MLPHLYERIISFLFDKPNYRKQFKLRLFQDLQVKAIKVSNYSRTIHILHIGFFKVFAHAKKYKGVNFWASMDSLCHG